MKTIYLLIKEDKDGFVKLKKQDLEKALQDAYSNGYEDGKKEILISQPLTTPTQPYYIPKTPYDPLNPNKIWYETNKIISNVESNGQNLDMIYGSKENNESI